MDSRFHLTVKFRIYGEEYDWDCSLNWSGNGNQIDRRIIEWFLRCHDEAYTKWQNKVWDEQANKLAAVTKACELDELKRLRAKYPEAT